MEKTRDLFKKTRDIKQTFHARMGMIKDRNSKDLTEAEEISSLLHPIVFLYFFALFIEEGLLIYFCFHVKLCIQLGISFPFSLAFHFSSFLGYL